MLFVLFRVGVTNRSPSYLSPLYKSSKKKGVVEFHVIKNTGLKFWYIWPVAYFANPI